MIHEQAKNFDVALLHELVLVFKLGFLFEIIELIQYRLRNLRYLLGILKVHSIIVSIVKFVAYRLEGRVSISILHQLSV